MVRVHTSAFITTVKGTSTSGGGRVVFIFLPKNLKQNTAIV